MNQDQETGAVIEVTDDNFAQTIQNNQPVLVDFWAAWCRPCQALSPIIEELARETVGRFVVGKLNIDTNSVTTREYNVKSIPTLIIFKGGQEVDRLTGLQTKEVLTGRLAAHAG